MATNKFDILKQIVPNATPDNLNPRIAADIAAQTTVKLSELIPFDNQPFKPYSDKELESLALSIQTHGVIVPIIVRPHQNKYQIISGYNRFLAAKLLGMTEIPALIRELDDDEAALTLVETNFAVRLSFAHSEKAKAYKAQYEALMHQRQKGTSCHQMKSSEELAESADDCERRIRQYVKISDLCDELLDALDSGKLPFLAAYNLAFLSLPAQDIILDYLNKGNAVDVILSEKIKDIGDNITEEKLSELSSAAPLLKISNVKIKFKDIKQYFNPSTTEDEITKIILIALEKYYAEVDNT